MSTFSALFAARRAELSLSFADLARKIGYHASYLSLVERGLRQLDEQGVIRVAQALGIDPGLALLGSLRQRLPEELRVHVPSGHVPTDSTASPTPAKQSRHAATRELQAEHFEYEVDRLRIDATLDFDGNLRLVRRFEDCRPNAAGAPVWQVSFRENQVQSASPELARMYPKFTVVREPEGLEYEPTTKLEAGRHHHSLFFPRGWRRSAHRAADAFSFSCETYQERVYALDANTMAKHTISDSLTQPLNGSFAIHLPHFVKRLEVNVDFPTGLKPERWEAWAWWGTLSLPNAPRNLVDRGVSRTYNLKADGGHAKLVVEEPLAGYTFAVVWAPPDRQTYLEARYGYSKDP